MKQTADITLVENSTAGNLQKTFPAQTVRIRHEPDAYLESMDFPPSYGRQPTEIEWVGGSASNFQHITDVIITNSTGTVLLDAEMNTNRDIPRDIQDGVRFFVMRR